MNRRTMLACLGSAALAGCSRLGGAGSNGDTPTPADAFGGEGGPNNVNVVDHRLVEYEQFGEETVAVMGVLHNGTGRWLSYLEASATFLDDSNVVVGDGFASIAHVRPNRSWRFNVAFHSESGEPSSVADYEFDGSYDLGSGDPSPDGVEVSDVEMTEEEQYGEQTKVVEGTVENVGDRDLDYVEVDVHFLDGDAVVVGENFSNKRELESGDYWEFEVDYFSPSRTHVSEAIGYDLVVTA